LSVASFEKLYGVFRVSKKIQVSFSDKQVELLERLKGEFGETDADVVRSIVLAWLAEKSFISTVIKHRINQEIAHGSDNEK
jgi:hypothetical protein